MPEGDRRALAYLLDRLVVAHGRRERLLLRALRALPPPAAAGLARRLLFRRSWLLDPASFALRPAEPTEPPPVRQGAWADASPLLAAAAEVIGGGGEDRGAGAGLVERSIVLRDYVGTGRRQLVLFPFPRGARLPSAVVKVASEPPPEGDAPDGSPSLRDERDALSGLAEALPPPLAATVPAPLAYRSRRGVEVLALSHLEGRPAYAELQNRLFPGRRTPVHLRSAAAWLGAFHAATRRSDSVVTIEPEDRLHASRLEGAAREGPPGWLEGLAAALERDPVPLAAGHGDFWARNLLMADGPGTPEGEGTGGTPPVAVVDWEHFRPAAPPFEDLFHFALTYGTSVRWRRGGRIALPRALGPTFLEENPVSDAIGAYLRRYARRTGLPVPLLEPLFRLHLLRRHRRATEAGERERWAACWRLLGSAEATLFDRLA